MFVDADQAQIDAAKFGDGAISVNRRDKESVSDLRIESVREGATGRHSSIVITVDVYGHLVPGSNRAAVDRLDEKPIRNPGATAGQMRNRKSGLSD
jgi:hypothetical protein